MNSVAGQALASRGQWLLWYLCGPGLSSARVIGLRLRQYRPYDLCHLSARLPPLPRSYFIAGEQVTFCHRHVSMDGILLLGGLFLNGAYSLGVAQSG